MGLAVMLLAASNLNVLAQSESSGWQYTDDGEPVPIDASAYSQGGYDHGDLGRDWPCPTYVLDEGMPGERSVSGVRRAAPQWLAWVADGQGPEAVERLVEGWCSGSGTPGASGLTAE